MYKRQSIDYIASRGEYPNGNVLAKCLGYEFIDSAEVILFDENGKFLSEEKMCIRDRIISFSFVSITPSSLLTSRRALSSDSVMALLSLFLPLVRILIKRPAKTFIMKTIGVSTIVSILITGATAHANRSRCV